MLVAIAAAVLVVRWLERPPSRPGDLCAVFTEKPGWYAASRRSAARWGVPEAVQMAVIYQESGFRARARPPRTKILWIIPWRRPSTAYGYAQVLDSTWQQFLDESGRRFAARYRFSDVAQFVGWYGTEIERLTGIPRDDAYRLYLAYHEGPAGYQRGSHQSKAWLLDVARKVESRADIYQRQYDGCRDRLWWLRVWRWTWRTVVFVGLLWLYVKWRGSQRSRRRPRRRSKRS